jgi:hypothetical protein
MTTVIIFAVSVVGLAILFLSKDREVKTGEKQALGKVLAKFDSRSENFIERLHYRLYELFQTVKFFFLVHLPAKGRVKIESAKESVMNNYNKQKETIMGKKELNGNNPSSFFLRKMSENKSSNSSGKIEESL